MGQVSRLSHNVPVLPSNLAINQLSKANAAGLPGYSVPTTQLRRIAARKKEGRQDRAAKTSLLDNTGGRSLPIYELEQSLAEAQRMNLPGAVPDCSPEKDKPPSMHVKCGRSLVTRASAIHSRAVILAAS